MNILHIIPSCDPNTGGPIEGIKQFNKEYKKNKIKAHLLTNDHPNSKYLKNNSLPKVYAVGPGKFKYGYNPKMKEWLIKML